MLAFLGGTGAEGQGLALRYALANEDVIIGSREKDKARKIILEAVQSILIDYSNQNPVSLIIDKKNIIVGKNDLEITDIIMDELNKKLPSVKLN